MNKQSSNSKRWPLNRPDVQAFLLDQGPCPQFSENKQLKLLDLFPDHQVIKIFTSQQRYSQSVLLKLLECKKDFPEEVSRILEKPHIKEAFLYASYKRVVGEINVTVVSVHTKRRHSKQ